MTDELLLNGRSDVVEVDFSRHVGLRWTSYGRQKGFEVLLCRDVECEVEEASNGMVQGEVTAGHSISPDSAVSKASRMGEGRWAFVVVRVVLEDGGSGLKTARVWIGSDGDLWQALPWVGSGGSGGELFELNFTTSIVPEADGILRFSAVGCGQVWLNGNDVLGGEIMGPGWSTIPEVEHIYRTYSIPSSLLHASTSQNSLRVSLARCKWGYREWWCSGDPSTCDAFKLQLTLGEQTITSNSTGWQVLESPVTFVDLYQGENYDNRVTIGPKAGATVVVKNNVIASTTAALGQGISRSTQHNPSAAPTHAGDGSWTFDVGVNIAGVCTMRASPSELQAAGLKEGDVLSFVHGELLHADGSVNNQFGGTCKLDAVNCANQTDNIILGSDFLVNGLEHTPTSTYHGFRHVGLYGWPSSPAPPSTLLSCHEVSNVLPPSSSVSFPSNPVLDAIQAAILQTQKNGAHHNLEDCPSREKRGWGGDNAVAARQATMNFDMESFYAEWLRTMRNQQYFGCGNPNNSSNHYECCDGQNRFGCNGQTPSITNGSVPDVIPFPWGPIGGFAGDPSWMALPVFVAYEAHRSYGSASLTAEVASLVRDYGLFLQATMAPSGILNWGYYGDWLALDKGNNSLVSTGNGVFCLQYAAQLMQASGDATHAALFTSLAAAMVKGFSDEFVSGGSAGGGSGVQTANSLAVLLKAPGATNATQVLVDDVKSHDTHVTVGLVGSRWILQALVEGGEDATAMALATTSTKPSWGYFVSSPSFPGTLWEQWTLSPSNPGGASFDHIMFGGGIGAYIHEQAAGVVVEHSPVDDEAMRSLVGDLAHALSANVSIKLPPTPLNIEPLRQLVLRYSSHTVFGKAVASRDAVALSVLQAALQYTSTIPSPTTAGSKPKIRIKPTPAALHVLGEVQVNRTIPQGMIQVSWKWNDVSKEFSVITKIPHGTDAALQLTSKHFGVPDASITVTSSQHGTNLTLSPNVPTIVPLRPGYQSNLSFKRTAETDT